jgi:succinyl-diaminopimelate desuccinylase
MPDYDLARRTLQLVDVPSESRDEEQLAEVVAAEMPLELVHHHACTHLFGTPRTGKPLVVLAGHLDTVPAQGNIPGRIEDGCVWGLGASDMKSGLAVMIELAHWIEAERPALDVDLGFLFFPREELPATESALPPVLEAGVLDDAALVIVLEPTDNTLQAGCLGHLSAEIVFDGVSAHSARPWQGRNAIEVAFEGLRPVLSFAPREVRIGGLCFVEVLSVTQVEGGIAGNVIPDRVTCTASFRYAPGRAPADALAELEELVGSAGRIEVLGNSPPARVVVDTPLVDRLRQAGDFPLEPKQAWTPVAEFARAGVAAINFGPGDPPQAHTRGEEISVVALVRSYRVLEAFARAL